MQPWVFRRPFQEQYKQRLLARVFYPASLAGGPAKTISQFRRIDYAIGGADQIQAR